MAGEPQSTGEPTLQPKPWRERLQAQGVSFDTSINIHPDFTTNATIDEKTGLPIENSAVRRKLAENFSESIRNGTKWAAFYVDADNLKTANTLHGHPFGDELIVNGAAKVTQAIKAAQLSPETKISVVRQESAADEEIVWVFNTSDEEIQRLQQHITQAETPTTIQDPEFTFSLSSTYIGYDDPRLQQQLEETKVWLAEDVNRVAFNTYQDIKDIAEADNKIIKAEKDLARLPMEQLLTIKGIYPFIDVLKNAYGNRRVGDEALDVLARLVSIQALRAIMSSVKNRATFQAMLGELGVSEQELMQNGDPKKMMSLFQNLYGKPEE